MFGQRRETKEHRFTFVSRLLVVAFALAQLVLPGTLSVLDGLVAQDSHPAVVHVEAPGSRHCPRVHDIDDCVICQFLAHASITPARNPHWIPAARLRRSPLAFQRAPRPEATFARLALPRAPPIA